jgi:predicted nuclease of restriction endonuclease-like (RecB) superfamily
MKSEPAVLKETSARLFELASAIIEQARRNIVHSVNYNIVLANWLIGRVIVEEIQSGKDRADYGTQLLETLSTQLSTHFGSGFSVANLKNFRQFYLTYSERVKAIRHPVGSESSDSQSKTPKSYPVGSELTEQSFQPLFLPRLSWSHYRALMRVSERKARDFYEKEAAESGWDKRDLERQIQSQYYERILSSQNPQALIEAGRQELTTKGKIIDVLKAPYVLEFLNLPDLPVLHESHIESAIITQLQNFLLELGKGFAFVDRQKRLQFESKDLYVDLVFYNCILKCYLLIDLKIDELTHQDVGQMDGYVRLFDDLYTTKDDNPTVGLILCTEKNEAVAKYSVLNDRKQIFASKYMLYMPSEEMLAAEIMRERRLIENRQEKE